MDYDQTHWAARRQQRPLPTFYYHEHFVEMLDFVARHYAHVLLDEHSAYIADFRALPRDAQCLYVRLVNRKGSVFAADRLRYPELGDCRPIIARLRDEGWVGAPGLQHFDVLLGFLTKAELYGVLLPRFAGLGRSHKKDSLLAFASEHLAPEDLLAGIDANRLLVQRRVDATRYLLFLYFGRVKEGLSQFTMRDLGLVKTQALTDSYEPRFSDRPEALENYYYATRLHATRSLTDADVTKFALETATWPDTNFAASATLRDELALKLGRCAEQAGDTDSAMAFYRKGESAKCSERLVRLMLASGDRDGARAHLERCLESPRSDEEWLVARDLYEQKFAKKRTSELTDVMRAAEQVDIDESRSGRPEQAVAEYFENDGMTAYRTENLVWRTLFGLLFWDELFGDGDASLNSPFDFLPARLQKRTFYRERQEAIEDRLSLLDDLARAKRTLLRVSTQNYGKPNGIFRWRRSMNDAVFALLEHAPPTAIRQVLRRLCRDYPDSRYGYPDLLVIDAEGARFVEVKTDGDQLRRNQLVRLVQLREAGFRADVVRVRWILDPDQAYVVVDVETTGGRGDKHRVTEVGAVKVRNGETVDRFHTLINPQRTIPANIARLTGITPAMVADAPYFADIADELEAFLQDSIFVAHNVEFDYGFIGNEFRRIGRSFRLPKLCTCASMRRLYPGHKSYSLAALCREYAIPLKQHHRALCDAEAAAELLLLVNEKRQAS